MKLKLFKLGFLVGAAVALMAAEGDPTANLEISFSLFITAPGIVVAAGLVRQFIQVIKTTFPGIDVRVSGALQAFIASAALYIATAAALAPTLTGPDGYLVLFAAWLAVALGAIGVDGATRHVSTKDMKGMTLSDPIPPDPDLSDLPGNR